MKKIILSCLLAFSCTVYSTQEIDHSVNLTSTYRTTSGTEIVFDLDQCSRLGSIAALMAFGGLGLAVENKKDKAIIPFLSVIVSALLFKAGVNIAMALKEFERNEIARGIEHLSCHMPILPHLYILLTRQPSNDRLLFYRISNLLTIFTCLDSSYMDCIKKVLLSYVRAEPVRFIRSCIYGNTPIRWSSCN